jgi:hypothetical protein
MKRTVHRSWVSGAVFLLAVAVLVVIMSQAANWSASEASTKEYKPGTDVERVQVSPDSRTPLATIADAEVPSSEVNSDQAVLPRKDLLQVVLKVLSTSSGLLPGCRIEIKGVSAPRWKISKESDLSGKVTFQWPAGHAFLAKVWPGSSSAEAPPAVLKVFTPTVGWQNFVMQVPGYAGLRATLAVADRSLPSAVFVSLKRGGEIGQATFGEGSLASLFRADADGLRNVWSGWTDLIGDQILVEQLPPGEYQIHFASSAGVASIPGSTSGVMTLVENQITDLGKVDLRGAESQAQLRIEELETGKAIPGALIRATPAGADRFSEPSFFEVKSDASGMAVFPLLSPGWRLTVSKDGYSTLDFYGGMLSKDRVNKLKLGPRTTLHISLVGLYQDLPDPEVAILQFGGASPGVENTTGQFDFPDVYPSKATVILASSGKIVEYRSITLLPGENHLVLGEVTKRAIRGTVATVDGPIQTGFVVLQTKDMEAKSAIYMQALRNGRFDLPLIEEETPTLLRVIPGGSWEDPDGYFSVPLSANDLVGEELQILLPNGAIRIDVPLNATGGKMISKVRMKRMPKKVLWGGYQGRMSFELFPDSSGRAVLRCLPAGEYELTWVSQAGRQSTQCEIVEGAVTQMKIE